MLRYCATGLPLAVKSTQTIPETEDKSDQTLFSLPRQKIVTVETRLTDRSRISKRFHSPKNFFTLEEKVLDINFSLLPKLKVKLGAPCGQAGRTKCIVAHMREKGKRKSAYGTKRGNCKNIYYTCNKKVTDLLLVCYKSVRTFLQIGFMI